MNDKRTKWFSIAIVFMSMALVTIIAFSNGDLKDAWGALVNMNHTTVWFGVLLYCLYVFSEGYGLWRFLRENGYRLSLGTAVHFSFAGLFYANATPSSSGGQPMQIYLMVNRGIKAGTATSALTVRFFFNQLAICTIVGVMYLLDPAFCATQLGGVKWFIIIGCGVNFAAVPLVILALINRPLVVRFGKFVIRLCVKLHICKNEEKWQEALLSTIKRFMEAIDIMLKKPMALVEQMLISIVEMLALFAVPLAVYYALGLSGTSPLHILIVSSMLFVSASYTPLPGASGAQEGGFLVYYSGIFTDGTISIALLVWRFLTFYLCLFVGVADSLYTNLRSRRAMLTNERDSKPEEENG